MELLNIACMPFGQTLATVVRDHRVRRMPHAVLALGQLKLQRHIWRSEQAKPSTT